MSSSVKTRDSALNAIKRYMTKSKDEAFLMDVDTVSSYLQLLNEQWVRFTAAQDDVETSCGSDNVEVQENARIQGETWYAEALANFKRVQKCRAEPPTQPAATSASVSAAIRLPKMDLPTFSGDSTDWVAFYDAFCSLVDTNTALSDGQKLHYLRSCLKGDALSIISGFKICDANYTEAWDLLKSRYKVMRVIVEAHLRAIADVRKASGDTADAIKGVLDAIQQHIRELKALGRPVDFWDDWLVHNTVNKLAFETRKQWELSLISDEPPTFEQLTMFLEIRCRSLAMITAPAPQATTIKPTTYKYAAKSTKVFHAIPEQNPARCTYCNAAHKIYSCDKFRSLDFTAKSKFIKESKACLNCLSPGHYKERCNSSAACRICHQRHHTLLHSNTHSPAATSAHVVDAIAAASNPASVSNHATGSSATALAVNSAASHVSSCLSAGSIPLPATQKSVILSTALVKIRDCAGHWQTARLLFDTGSHASFVTEACVQRLGLTRSSSSVFVTGICSSQGGRCRGETLLTLSSNCSDKCYDITALILPKITNDLPTQTLSVSSWPHIQGLFLADPNFAKPGRIDVLVGMDVMDQLICVELRKGPSGTPMAQKTVFGWTLFGNVDSLGSPTPSLQSLHCDVQLDRALARLWELEDSPQKQHLTHEENFCENHFNSTHQRMPDGRFVVELPLKPNTVLGESRNFAIRNLLCIERRLASNSDLRLRYDEFMRELIDMGHMEEVFETTSEVYYMPHHPVIKESSVTTKLRVVFNASAKTTTGNSLNDALFVGPQLQQDLYSILLRFRTHRYAVTADVAKMYRQVCVSSKHVDLQRIVWRPDPSSPIRDYRMLRVTYGVAAASHLAVKALQQTAKCTTNGCKKAVDAILNDFYMDDLLTGASCKSQLRLLQQNVSEILQEGGFELRKWASNCAELKEIISKSSQTISHYIVDGKDVHALGLIWNIEGDYFTFAVDLKEPPAILTKRAFLSDASILFDPLGLLAPVTICSKMWFQDIWRAEVGWDDLIPDTIANLWVDHRVQLQKLVDLK
ncbi:uncharacterized protein LOC118756404, partial [Rhagoletis pomonella]|uniref:uncharacterized protein LOC118756404 n=1 Tax=Rhagoletis pomonella TaxID=28610 RepID=UPI00177A9F98